MWVRHLSAVRDEATLYIQYMPACDAKFSRDINTVASPRTRIENAVQRRPPLPVLSLSRERTATIVRKSCELLTLEKPVRGLNCQTRSAVVFEECRHRVETSAFVVRELLKIVETHNKENLPPPLSPPLSLSYVIRQETSDCDNLSVYRPFQKQGDLFIDHWDAN